MTLLTTTLRPGLMVHVGTSLKGNVRYFTNELIPEYTNEDGESHSKWETEKTIRDPEEHERAVNVRSLARSKIQCVCIQSDAFGLFCQKTRRDELDAAITEARALVREFNKTAKVTKISFYAQVGEIAENEAQAIRDINREVRGLIESMAQGLRDLDPAKVQETVDAVREAANRARSVSAMLTPDAQAQVADAIEAARKAATNLKKAATLGAVEIDRAAIRRIEEARTGFLDLDDNDAPLMDVETRARALDIDTPDEVITAPPMQARLFDAD